MIGFLLSIYFVDPCEYFIILFPSCVTFHDEIFVVVLVFSCMSFCLSFLFSFSAAIDKGSRVRKLKHDVIEAVNELIQDISTCYEQIAEQAVEHIHHKCVSHENSLNIYCLCLDTLKYLSENILYMLYKIGIVL